MKKRMLPIFIILFISCNQEQIDQLNSDLESCQIELENCKSELEEAKNKLSNIEYKVSDLESEIKSLENEVDDFGYEDWQYNVWDVENATSNVVSALEDLKNEF